MAKFGPLQATFDEPKTFQFPIAATLVLPTLSSVGASLAEPCFRLHAPLIEPDRRIYRIRLSEKVSRGCHGTLPVRTRRTMPAASCR